MPANHDAIITPQKTPRSPVLSERAIIAATRPDVDGLRGVLPCGQGRAFSLHLSQIFCDDTLSLAGPVLGAPAAVMLLEHLIAWGAREIVFLGWAGAISPDCRIGDWVVPRRALIDEGTSGHYENISPGSYAEPDPVLTKKLHQRAARAGHHLHQGDIWSTDAVFRETRNKVRQHQKTGILGVEMEVSALCTVARFRSVRFAALLVISDELASLHWKPGFKSPAFRAGRKAAGQFLADFWIFSGYNTWQQKTL